MNESLLNRILKDRKRRTRSLALILCLSMIVSLGTFAGFHKNAIAKVYTREVLDCPYTHEGAEPVAHVHNDDCYDGKTLVCTLPELEAHTHSDACYTESQVLTCTLEENPGHQHGDACYTEREELRCGLEENPGHQHGDACYTEREVLRCGLEENPGHQHGEACYDENGVLTCQIPEGEVAHTHTAECYETVRELSCQIPEGEGAHAHTAECYETVRELTCGKQELTPHVHGPECIRKEEITVDEPEVSTEPEATTVPEMPVSDPNADLESASDWERDFDGMELSGNWAEDLVLVAATQQGHGESQNNFEAVLNDAGDAWVRHGYTRYGAWSGAPYADEWSAMFVSFCLRYAGIPAENVPNNPTAALMAESFQKGELFAGPDYLPAVGDLIFFDTDDIDGIDHMGIVYHVDEEDGSINAVEGSRTDAVETFGYHLDDEEIAGYGILPQNPNFVPDVIENEDNIEGEDDGFVVMTTDEEEEKKETEETKPVEETKAAEEVTAPAVPMPAQSWERTAGGIKVTVEAPEGAFPENTKIAVTPVNGNSLKDTVSDAVSGEVLEVQAVDITFFDADGNEIEPAVPIRVVMTPAETQNAEEKANVVHIDLDQQTAEVIEQAAGTETDNSEVVFDAEAFTIYAIVYTYDVHFEYEVDGKTYTPASSMPGAKDLSLADVVRGLGIVEEQEIDTFVSKISTVASTDEAVVSVGQDGTIRVLKDGEAQIVITMQDGAQFNINVLAEGETEVSDENNVAVVSTVNDLYLPSEAAVTAEVLDEAKSENAIAAVQTVTEPENSPAADAAYQVFEISLDGVEATDYNGFQVEVKLPENVVGRDFRLFHVHDGKVDELKLDNVDTDGEPVLLESVSFVTPSFSQFVLYYTVDFHYEGVDYSIPGESQILLSTLIEILNITDATGEKIDVRNVDRVTLTDEHLVSIQEVSGLITYNNQAGINVGVKDFLLTSLKPFTSKETLTLTLTGGWEIAVDMTDDQSTNLSNFHPEVTIVGVTPGPDGTYDLKSNKDYTIELHFHETQGELQFDDTQMVYPLPEGLVGTNQNKDFKVAVQKDGTTYTISGNKSEVKDGILIIKWNKDDPNYDKLTEAGNTELTVKITEKVAADTTQLNFEGAAPIMVRVEDNGGLTVTKTASYDSNNGVVNYTLELRAVGDNNNSIVLTDRLTGGEDSALELLPNTISIQKNYNNWAEGQAIIDETPASSAGFSYAFGNLTLNNGDYVKLSYQAKVLYDKLENVAEGNGETFTSITGNDANLTYKYGDTPGTDTDHKEFLDTEITYKDFSKDGTVQGEEVDINGVRYRLIDWVIKTNSYRKLSIAGTTVKDTIAEDSKDIMSYYGDVSVIVTKEDGSKETRSFTPDPANPIWQYNIPSTDGKYAYEFQYQTKVKTEDILEKRTVTNNSEGDQGAGGKSYEVAPDAENQFTAAKSVSKVSENEVLWSIEVAVPENGFTSLVVEDTYPVGNNGAYHDSFKAITEEDGLQGKLIDGVVVTNLAGNETFTVDTSDSTKAVIAFSKDGTNPGLADTGVARKIRIFIKTQVNSEWAEWAKTAGAYATWHTNKGVVTANSISKNVESQAIPKNAEVKKQIHEGNNGIGFVYQKDDGTYGWTNTPSDNNVNYPAYIFRVDFSGVSSDTLSFTDIFDNKLEHVHIGDNSVPGLSDVIYAHDSQWTWNTNQRDISDQYMTEGDGRIEFNIPVVKNGEGYYQYYTLFYVLRAKDPDEIQQAAAQNMNRKYPMTNMVEWATTSSNLVEFDYTYQPMSKVLVSKAEEANGYKASYSFTFNSEKADYGQDILTLEDEHSPNQIVDYNSIRVSTDPANRVGDVTYDFSGQIGTFKVPNKTKVTVTYVATVNADGTNKDQGYWNELRFNGDTKRVSDTAQFSFDTSGVASNPSIRLMKYQTGDMTVGLQGAEFELYYTDNDHPEKTKLLNPATESGRFITNAEGYVQIIGNNSAADPERQWNLVKMSKDTKNTTYYLKEVKTPDGYSKNVPGQSIPEYWQFRIDDQKDYSQWIYLDYDILKIYNTPIAPVLKLNKSFSGDWDDMTQEYQESITDSLSFSVTGKFQKGHMNGENWVNDGEPIQKTITLPYKDYFSGGAYSLTEWVEGDDHYHLVPGESYTISESSTVPQGYTQTTTYSTPSIDNGNEQSASVTLSNTDLSKATVSFDNKYDEISTTIKATKVWNDNNDQQGKRPESISLTLYKDGQPVEGSTKTITSTDPENAAARWEEVEWNNLEPKHEYSVVEKKLNGYATTYTPASLMKTGTITVTNTRNIPDSKQTELEVEKVWSDGNQNHDGESVAFKLITTETKSNNVIVRFYNGDTELVGSKTTAPKNAEIKVTFEKPCWIQIYDENDKFICGHDSGVWRPDFTFTC